MGNEQSAGNVASASTTPKSKIKELIIIFFYYKNAYLV
jgi:hypothetical protein